jgi:1-aminocyclopropane-1-carboxylate deaminase/D-cysteine desulfhydrase-like pyridoxal-dependent ACC family enzyme
MMSASALRHFARRGGMIGLIRKGFFKKDETVLFWHTGGQPALFAEKYANKI